MRKFAVAGLAALLLSGGAVALAAGSWPAVTVKPTVSPDKAGTVKHPQGVKLTTIIRWKSLGSYNQPIVTHFHVLFPKGSQYNGAKYTVCSLSRLNSRGPAGCPKASIMGHGTGNAYADTTVTHPQITVVNGGSKVVYFYTVLNNPARVQEPVIGHLKKTRGKWAYSLSVTVPKNLRIVAGVPIELTYLKVVAGKGSWLATTSCSGGHWPFSITTTFENPNNGDTGQSSYSASTPCRR
jgi:hypothetical protein